MRISSLFFGVFFAHVHLDIFWMLDISLILWFGYISILIQYIDL